MLQQMRSFAKSKVASVFLFLVVGSFTLWGVADVFRGRVSTDVAEVGSEAIPQSTYARDYRNLIQTQSQRLRQQITPDMARKMGLSDALLKDMISRAALDSLVDKMGVVVSDADVSDAIRNIQAFYGPLGVFDKQTFLARLRERQYTEDEFIEQIRKEMARAQVTAPVQGGFQVPPGYAHALFTFSTEVRAVQYVVVSPQQAGTIAPPADQVLEAYVKSHAQRFSTPEYRHVSIAYIGPEDVSAGIKITDDQVKRAYDAQKSAFVIPEQRNVEQVSFPSQAAAKAARDKIDQGKSFADMAREAGKTVDDRGSVTENSLGALGKPAFALAEGQVSQPAQNFSSWALIHVTKITPGKTTTLDMARADLVKQLTEQTAQAKISDMANVYNEQIGDGAEVAESAKKSGLKFVRIPAVDAQGLAPDGTKPAGLPTDPELLAHLFSADVEAGEPTETFTTTSGHTYGVNVDGITPPKLKPFAAVRAQALADWTGEQAAKLLKKRAAELAAQAQRDGNLDGVAKTLGSPVLSGSSLGRNDDSELFSSELMDRIFGVPAFSVVSGPAAKGGNYVIARVSGVVHPPLPPGSRMYKAGLRDVANQIGQDITILMGEQKKKELGVTINQKLVDQAVGGGGAEGL